MHGLSINVSSVEWPEETRDGEWGRGNGRDSVSACMKRVLDMERVRTASPLSYTPQEGNAHLRQKLHGWHLVLAKKLAQTVVQAQPFTPALAPLMSMGQPQFDVCNNNNRAPEWLNWVWHVFAFESPLSPRVQCPFQGAHTDAQEQPVACG